MAQQFQDVDLDQFLSYRLETLSHSLSHSIAAVLEKRFDLSMSAWRVMVVLARHPQISAIAVSKHAQLDKVAVSRAVNRLIKHGRVDRRIDPADRRRSILKLSVAGEELFEKVAPLALQMEADLLKNLTESELDVTGRTIDKLLSRSDSFGKPYLSPVYRPAAPVRLRYEVDTTTDPLHS